MTLENAEKYIGLEWLTYEWHPTRRLKNPWCENLLWLTPEILKPHLYMLVFTSYLVTLVYFLFFFNVDLGKGIFTNFSWPLWCNAIVWLGNMVFVIWLDRHYYIKLQEKLELKKRIRRRAYELYEERVRQCQYGNALDDWSRAESETDDQKRETTYTGRILCRITGHGSVST